MAILIPLYLTAMIFGIEKLNSLKRKNESTEEKQLKERKREAHFFLDFSFIFFI